MKFLLWLGNVDRRILYVLMAAVLLIPLVRPIGLPISITDDTRKVYSRIDQLKLGDRVVLDFDYGPDSKAELQSQAISILKQLAKKDVRVIAIAFAATGPMIAEDALSTTYGKAGKTYGQDYCNLGYLAGGETGQGAFIRDPLKACPVDFRGGSSADLPILQGIASGKDIQLLIYFTTGYTAEWIRQAGPLGVPIIGGVITVLGPAQQAFVQSGQLQGLLVGMRSGAEYELLIDEPGPSVAAMDAQSLGHLLFIGFVVLGNIAQVVQKRAAKSGKGA